MPIYNLPALLYHLQNKQLREFDASSVNKIGELKAGKVLTFSTALIAAIILPNGHLGCLTDGAFQVIDVETNHCIKQFVLRLTDDQWHRSDIAVSGLHLLPDGEKILIIGTRKYSGKLSYSNDDKKKGWTQIWDITTGQCLLKTHEGPHVLINGGSALNLYLPPGTRYREHNKDFIITPQPNYYYTVSQTSSSDSCEQLIALSNSLKTINLHLAPLEQHDVLPLLNAIIATPDVMRRLSLRGVALDDEGFQQVLTLVQTNTRLKSLNLEGTGLREEQKIGIKKAWFRKGFQRDELSFLSSPFMSAPMVFTSLSDFSVHQLQRAEYVSDPPSRYLCPLTRQMMLHAVIAQDGHNYEEEAMQAHFKNKDTSPTTHKPLRSKELIPNYDLRADIHDLLEKTPAYWELVYFSKASCLEVEQACERHDSTVLEQLLQQDRRLLTRKVFSNQTKFILEALCEEKSTWINLVPIVVKLLTPSKWEILLFHKPLVDWLKQVAQIHVQMILEREQEVASYFLTSLQNALGKTINAIELTLYALQERHESLFRWGISLVDAINQAVDLNGNTLLHLAAQQGQTAMVHSLVERGAKVKQRNYDDKKPETLAREVGHVETAEAIFVIKIAPVLARLGIIEQLQRLQQRVTELEIQQPPNIKISGGSLR